MGSRDFERVMVRLVGGKHGSHEVYHNVGMCAYVGTNPHVRFSDQFIHRIKNELQNCDPNLHNIAIIFRKYSHFTFDLMA